MVFRKLERGSPEPAAPPGARATAPPPAPAPAELRPEPRRGEIEPAGRRALLVGLALAVAVSLVPFLSFVFSYLTTLVHELGHALAGWTFGYPSIPAFDFRYGGGLTSHEQRRTLLMLIIYAGFVLLLYRYRADPRRLAIFAGFVALYTVLAFTDLHRMLIVFMGHGSELVFAGIFLYRAISGAAIKVPLERPLYAFVGFFIVISDVAFAYKLITNDDYRALYEQAKGGGHWMDFSVLAEQHLGTDLGVVAGFFLLCCVLPVAGAYATHRFGPGMVEGLARLLRVAPSGEEASAQH